MSSNSSRNVVVLGANRGLGLAFASRYLEAGDHVVATARDLDAAGDLAALAARHEGRATLARADLADGASLEALAGIVPFERIDLLLVNAGVFGGEEGRIAHGEVRIEGTVVMLTDAQPEWPANPANVHVYVPDVDAVHSRSLAAGATEIQAPVQKDDPDKRGGFRDAGGTTWWVSTQVDG